MQEALAKAELHSSKSVAVPVTSAVARSVVRGKCEDCTALTEDSSVALSHRGGPSGRLSPAL
jgi:hypothetical protein